MRATRVSARAFGWLRDETLELAEGLTVVYGPNEAGKSTWHAALVAALCGRWPSRARGEPGIERYRPWSGDAWEVGAELLLDDGRRIDLRQDLAARHGWATDRVLGRDIAAEITGAKGVPDASRWLGLERAAFLAAACVRQSQVTFATDEVNGIRTYVEGAAATATSGGTSADETAAAALGRIDAFRRDHVGTERAEKKPLALAQRRLAEAGGALRAARSRRDELDRRTATAADLRAAAAVTRLRLARHEAALASTEATRLHQRATEAARLAASPEAPTMSVTPTASTEVPSPRAQAQPSTGQVRRAAPRDYRAAEPPAVVSSGQVRRAVPSAPSASPRATDPGERVRRAGPGGDRPAAVSTPTTSDAGSGPTPAGAPQRGSLLLGVAGALVMAGLAVCVMGWPAFGVILVLAGIGLGVVGFVVGRSVGEPDAIAESDAVAELEALLAQEREGQAARDDATARRERLRALLEGGSVEELAELARRALRRADALTQEVESAAAEAGDESPVDAAADLDELRRVSQEAAHRAALADKDVAQVAAELDHAPVAEAEETFATAQAEVARLAGLDDVLDRTQRFLRRAQERVHRAIAPTLAAAVSRDLAAVTAGRYIEAVVDPQSLDVTLHGAGASAAPRRVDQVSVGTREQVYLLVRVALAERLVTAGASCPLLLDDVTVHADADRTARILDVLLTVAERHQVILFTQQEQVRAWAAALTDSRHALRELTVLAPV